MGLKVTASAPFSGVTSCTTGWIAVLSPMVMDILFIGSFAVKARVLSASRYLLADASLRIVFLACKDPELEFAGDGTSVNRIHESGCGFALWQQESYNCCMPVNLTMLFDE